MTLIYLSLAWLAGIALAARLPDTTFAFWLVPAGLALIGLRLGREHRPARLFFGCGLLLTLGAARYALAVPSFGPGDLATYNDQGFATIEGIIIDAPDVRDTHVNLRVRAERLTLDGESGREVKGEAVVQAPRFGDYRYGESVRVLGELQTPPSFEDFSYQDYLARQGVYSIVSSAEVELLGERRGSPFRRVMLDFRASAQTTITRLLPDPQSSLLTGILLGVESGITPRVRDDFNATGATHVIAISGANLAILAGVLRGFTRRWMSPKWSAGVTVLGVFTYTLFVGGDPAVMRAFVMATVGITGEELFRRTYAPASLSFAAMVMTAFNPTLLWDVGFLLSFLSTWGIVLYVDPLAGLLERGLSLFLSGETATQIVAASAEAVLVTIAAQITTTPISALFFERLSLVSLPVNLLIVPAQGPLMILGGVAVLIAFVVWPLGQLLAWADWLFLTYTVVVVRFFADLPFASREISVSAGAVWGFFLLLFGGTFIVAQPHHRLDAWKAASRRALGVKVLATAGLLLTVLMGAVAWSMPDGRLHVYFLDVPGSATLIRTPTGRTILVDAGGSGRALSTGLGDAMPFWDRKLDMVILTQPVPDHVAGLPPAMTRYEIDTALTNGQRGEGDEADAIWEALDEAGVPIQVAQPGMQVHVDDGVTLTVLDAGTADEEFDETESGQPVVLMVEYGDARFLLSGDLTEDGEETLLESDAFLASSVLQVPSHGDEAVCGEALLDAVEPQVAVIPVTGMPDVPTVERLEATSLMVYQTGRDSMIHIATDGTRLQVWPRQPGT
jgi:competence protein ComEC